MKKKASVLVLLVATAGLGVTGCSSKEEPAPQPSSPPAEPAAKLAPEQDRGSFGMDSCASSERIAVNSDALYAVYVDGEGNPVDGIAEDLTGTHDNMMCPTPPAKDQNPHNPQACANHYCPRVVNGKQVCFRC